MLRHSLAFLALLALLIPLLVFYVFRETLLGWGVGVEHILIITVEIAIALLLLFYVLGWRLLIRYILAYLLLLALFFSTLVFYFFRRALLGLGVGIEHILVIAGEVAIALLLLFYILGWRLLVKYVLLLLFIAAPVLGSTLTLWYVFKEAFLGLGVGLEHILVISGEIAIALLLLFYILGWRLLLRWYNAREIREGSIMEKAREIGGKKGVKVRLFTADIGANALSFGRAGEGYVVVSRSLLDLLDSEEIEAVLFHEITVLKDKHSIVYTIAALIAGIVTSIPTLAFKVSLLVGFGQEDDPAPNLIKLFVMSVVAPFAAFLIYLLVPSGWKHRWEDDKLLSALGKLELNKKEGINPAHSFLFLVNPLLGGMTTILDFKFPTYKSLFRLSNPTNEGLVRMLSYSFMSYMVVLFGIIVLYTFIEQDFMFKVNVLISAFYTGLVLVFLLMLIILVRLRTGYRFRSYDSSHFC
ncbi:MAG: M48 family metalloprotease [Candidatus Hadarchaeota archaeon]